MGTAYGGAEWARALLAQNMPKPGRLIDLVDAVSGDAEWVTRIAATIAEVATQTNILAVDAVIEAARAREYGRGVAVVAESACLVAAIAVEEQSVTIGSLGECVAMLHRIGHSNATAAEEITVTMIDLSRLAGDTRCVVESLAMTEESPAS